MAGIDNYTLERAEHYDVHHRGSLRNRLTTWREVQVVGQALRDAHRPRTALDLPCGTGRFWPIYPKNGVTQLIAGDGSQGMLAVAERNRVSPNIPQRLVETSAFEIDLPDNCVEFFTCLRFYHHLSRPQDREILLQEIGRVSKQYAAISLWVDGNLAGNRRLRRPPPVVTPGYGRRICRRREEVEAEFQSAGFRIIRHYDVWPRIYMWRLYLLEQSIAN